MSVDQKGENELHMFNINFYLSHTCQTQTKPSQWSYENLRECFGAGIVLNTYQTLIHTHKTNRKKVIIIIIFIIEQIFASPDYLQYNNFQAPNDREVKKESINIDKLFVLSISQSPPPLPIYKTHNPPNSTPHK